MVSTLVGLGRRVDRPRRVGRPRGRLDPGDGRGGAAGRRHHAALTLRGCAAAVALAAAGLTGPGCADEVGPAFDIELVQDLNIDTEEQVLSLIDGLILVADSPEGLYSSPAGVEGGEVEVLDVDGDGAFELVATVPLGGERLPWIRLEQGGLPDLPLTLRVFGVRGDAGLDEPLAEGAVSGVRFGEGVLPLAIPFNIRPELLPPRVTDVIPGTGDYAYDCTFGDVVVLFSRPMDEASLQADGAIRVEPGGAPLSIRTDGSGLVAHLTVPPIEGTGRVSYGLSVSSEATSVNGQGLDQVPSEPGQQPFDETFSLLCTEGPALPEHPCGLVPGGSDCPWPTLLHCVEGCCVPSTCEGLECPESFVCDPETSLCEVGCEAYGCPDPTDPSRG